MTDPQRAALEHFVAVLVVWGSVAACAVGVLHGLVELVSVGRVWPLVVRGVIPALVLAALRSAARVAAGDHARGERSEHEGQPAPHSEPVE